MPCSVMANVVKLILGFLSVPHDNRQTWTQKQQVHDFRASIISSVKSPQHGQACRFTSAVLDLGSCSSFSMSGTSRRCPGQARSLRAETPGSCWALFEFKCAVDKAAKKQDQHLFHLFPKPRAAVLDRVKNYLNFAPHLGHHCLGSRHSMQ